MKLSKTATILLRLVAMFALSATISVQAEEATPSTIVSYDRANDHLSITADAASLKRVLGKIALKSGIEVLFDDAADEVLTINFQSLPLDDGVKQILKGRNHILSYDRDEKTNKSLLIGVMVLPAGEQDRGRAKRVMAMDDESYYRAKSQLSLEQVQKIDMANERWQARLGKLPPDRVQEMEKRTAKRLLKDEKRKEMRAKMKEKNEKKRAEQMAKQQKRQQTMLQKLDPEQRAIVEQRNAEAGEQIRKKLLEIESQDQNQ